MVLNIKIDELIEKINKSQTLVIYGAGNNAFALNELFLKNGIHASYCVITRQNGLDKEFSGLPLYTFDQCISDMKKESTVTIVAVMEVYEAEIEEGFMKNGIKNYILMSDYQKLPFQEYEGKTKQDYLVALSKWYAQEHKLSLENLNGIQKRLEEVISEHKREKHKILFAIGNLSPRVNKLAMALRKKGYVVEVLLYPDYQPSEIFWNELKGICSVCSVCLTTEELMYRILVSQAQAVHLFSQIPNTYIARILIQHKELFPKIVFEQYDIANEMYLKGLGVNTKANLADERYCLEHADGICCRGYELEYLTGEMGYKIPGKIIRFFDYCSD